MTSARRGFGVGALALLLGPVVAQAQAQGGERPPTAGADEVAMWAAPQVAAAWDVPEQRIRIEVAGEVPNTVDSVFVEPGAGDRWIVAFWSEDDVIRRFARAGVMRSVPVAATELSRGRTIQADDVRLEERVVWGPPAGAILDPVGMVAERRLPAGEILQDPSIRAPVLIRGGDPIEAIFETRGVILRIKGEALASGREGDRILVRLASGQRMAANAVAPGVVEIIGGGS